MKPIEKKREQEMDNITINKKNMSYCLSSLCLLTTST
jgi:hypothetical protein